MKKIILILMSIVFIISLNACKQQKKELTSSENSVAVSSAEVQTPTPTASITPQPTKAPLEQPSPIITNDENGIVDIYLYKVVLKSLGKNSGEAFTKKEAQSITFLNYYALDGKGEKIKSLKGIELLENLTFLSLNNNLITDFSPVLGLKRLKSLNLNENKIEDISQASKLTNLDVLNLSYNSITDISPLSSLINLKELNLWYNNIEEISPLLNLKGLNLLNLESNYIDMSQQNNKDNVQALQNRIKYFALGLQGVKSPETHIFKKVNLFISPQQTLERDKNIKYIWANLDGKDIELSTYYEITEPKNHILKMRDNLGTDYKVSFTVAN